MGVSPTQSSADPLSSEGGVGDNGAMQTHEKQGAIAGHTQPEDTSPNRASTSTARLAPLRIVDSVGEVGIGREHP